MVASKVFLFAAAFLFCVAVERQTMRKTILFSHPAKTSTKSYLNPINNTCPVYIDSRFRR